MAVTDGFLAGAGSVDGIQRPRRLRLVSWLRAYPSPQGLVFKAVFVKIECAAVFADRAQGGIVEAFCALAVDLNGDFHVVRYPLPAAG